MARLIRPQILAGDAVWLLTLDYAGRTWRIATERVSITSTTPLGTESLEYDPGLTPIGDVDQVLAGIAASPESRSVSLEVAWPDGGSATTVAELIQRGHDLAAGRGEVALWVAGTAYEDRIVVVSGLVREPDYGARGEGIALTIEDQPWDDTARIVAGEANTTAWPTVHTDHEGRPYPWVFGAPGADGASGGFLATGSPAIAVEYAAGTADTLLVAGHHVYATTCRIVFDTGTAIASVGSLTIDNAFDGLGRPVATIDVTGAGALLRTAVEWWVCWEDGPALRSPYRVGGIQTAGELLRLLADLSSVRVDAGAWAALAEALPWPVGGYVDDPATTPLGYLQDAVLPLLPVGLVAGDRGGLVPVLWRHDARREDAIDWLTAGPGVVREGRVRYERAPRDVVQRITVMFGLDDWSGDYRRTLDLRPDPDLDNPDHTTSLQAVSAANRYLRPGEPHRSKAIEAPIVWDRGTAARIAHWRIRSDGYAPRRVDYQVQADRAWIRPGDVVLLTDADLAIEDTIALVVERRLSDLGAYRLTLQILDDVSSRTAESGPGANGPPDWVDPQ